MATATVSLEIGEREITAEIHAREESCDYGVDRSPQWTEFVDPELTALEIDGVDIPEDQWSIVLSDGEFQQLVDAASDRWELEEPDYDDSRDD